MFYSLNFKMASNFTPEEDEPMHPAGLHMMHESLCDILDGNEVNVSTALPSVPQDTTNPFLNPNQTLADVIHGRDLGPLSSLKITDADLIIRNLNKELNAAAEKNDNSVALLQGWISVKNNSKLNWRHYKPKRKPPFGKDGTIQ